jgi:hypothetical protein
VWIKKPGAHRHCSSGRLRASEQLGKAVVDTGGAEVRRALEGVAARAACFNMTAIEQATSARRLQFLRIIVVGPWLPAVATSMPYLSTMISLIESLAQRIGIGFVSTTYDYLTFAVFVVGHNIISGICDLNSELPGVFW